MAGAIAASVYASNKGRSGGGIFLLSLFLSPLVGFLVAAAMQPHEKEIARAKGMLQCPDCTEFVQPGAKICRFCRYEFVVPESGEGKYVPAWERLWAKLDEWLDPWMNE